MVDAYDPQMPSNSPAVETRQRFDSLVDQAFRQHTSNATKTRGPKPAALLSYVAGSLEGDAREAFERELERTNNIHTVIATMKAARPATNEASFSRHLSSTITRQLLNLISTNPNATANDIIHSFCTAAHQAALSASSDSDLQDIKSLFDNDDKDKLIDRANALQGFKRALTLGSAGKLDAANQLWSKTDSAPSYASDLPSSLQLLLNKTKPQKPSNTLLSKLSSKLANSSQDSSSLLSILLDFTHSSLIS